MALVNTGWKIYNQLVEIFVDNGTPTGNVKPNDSSDPDYIAPVWDPDTCPYVGYDGGGGDTDIPGVYTIETSVVGSGSITLDPNTSTYLEGDDIVATASPGLGFTFDEWEGSPGTSSGNQKTFTNITENLSVTAKFVQLQKIITVQTGSYTSATARISVDGVSKTLTPGAYTYNQGAIIRVLGTGAGSTSDCASYIDTFDSYAQTPTPQASSQLIVNGVAKSAGYEFTLNDNATVRPSGGCSPS